VTIAEQRDPFRHGDYEPRHLRVVAQNVEMGDVVKYTDGTWRCVDSMYRGGGTAGQFGFFTGNGPVRPPRWELTGKEGAIEVIRFPRNVEPTGIQMQSLREGVWILDGASGGRVGCVSAPLAENAEGFSVEVQGATEPFVLQPESQGWLFAFRVLP
jgi:hypothetical protein